jgi:hypothetical protein
LAFALGANFHLNEVFDIRFGKQLLALSMLSIGVYAILVENETTNSSTQAQAIVIAIVTQYRLANALKDLLYWELHKYFVYIYIAILL